MNDVELVIDNRERSRFELTAGDDVAFAAYEQSGSVIIFIHTEVPEAFRGQGVGAKLARAALDSARKRGLQVVPLCPFIAAYIRRHPDYLDLVSESNRRRLNLETAS